MSRNIRKMMAWAINLAAAALIIYGALRANYHADVLSGEYARLKQALSAGDVIRLHVIADSDEPEAQRLKLIIRDTLLERYADKLSSLDAAAALEYIPSILPEIERLASDTALANSFSGRVEASFGKDSFPYREYAGMPVPAGTYDSLIVRIGSAQGRNWWCVMYPPLCMLTPDTLDAAQAAVPALVVDKAAEAPAASVRLPDMPPPAGRSMQYTRSHVLPSAHLTAIAARSSAPQETAQAKPLFRSVILDWLRELF